MDRLLGSCGVGGAWPLGARPRAFSSIAWSTLGVVLRLLALAAPMPPSALLLSVATLSGSSAAFGTRANLPSGVFASSAAAGG